MTYRFLLLICALGSSSAFADPNSPGATVFGKGVTLPVYGSDKCDSSKILDQAVEISGVNVLGKKQPNYSASCSELGKGLPLDSKVPFVDGSLQEACRKGQSVRCFGESGQSKNGLCIVEPSVEATKEVYGDSQNTSYVRPRFQAIYAFSADSSGNQNLTSWQMDSAGCNPVAGHAHGPGGSGPVRKEECINLVTKYLKGGAIYDSKIFKSMGKDAPKDKFCDGKSLGTLWNQLDELNRCKTVFPNLVDREGKLAVAAPKPKQNSVPANDLRGSFGNAR